MTQLESNLKPNTFAGAYLDRAVHLRTDIAAQSEMLRAAETLIVPLWRGRHLVQRDQHGTVPRMLSAEDFKNKLDVHKAVFLGLHQNRPCFAVELADEDGVRWGAFEELRALAPELNRQDAELLGYARALLLWRANHRFCSRCGAVSVPSKGGHAIRCSKAECGYEQFPRIDPAIIVLVTHADLALLGRQASWPPRRYSTIAGYVEPGESLEDAVAREVMEETGIAITQLCYHSSQPWPFPASLMLGFVARAAHTQISRNDQELEDARWFSRAQLVSGEILLPPPTSIAFRLIEQWYDAAAPKSLHEELGRSGMP